MPSWRELAANVAAQEAGQTAAPTTAGQLPDDIRDGLNALRTMAPPAGAASDEVWREIVGDAVKLARRGWVEQALALGWHPLDLFGCGTADDPFVGLAVWLAGRRVVLVDENSAMAISGTERSIFYRRPLGEPPKPVLLWDLGGKGK